MASAMVVLPLPEPRTSQRKEEGVEPEMILRVLLKYSIEVVFLMH